MKNAMNGRKGSYLVEAALTLPVFILGVTALAMIVNLIGICETIGFVMSREVKENLFLDAGILNRVSLCRTIEAGVEEEQPGVSDFQVRNVRCGVQSGGITDLITVTAQADFQILMPAGIGGKTQFEQKLMARFFTGTEQAAEPLNWAAFTESGKSLPVMVYPKYGERFHKADCAVVRQQTENGNPAWEMDRQEARLRMFTPCEICGGGEV